MHILETGTLRQRLMHATQHALRCGALQPITSRHEIVQDGGVNFTVRVMENLARKEESGGKPAPDFNPFLPYDKDLFVTDLSDTHLILLNKFNVIEHHLLIVTRQFEEQESPINARDFAAAWQCLAESDGLVFYNSGTVSGASQRHKHLQLVPLPAIGKGERIPLEPAIEAALEMGEIAAALPFRHVLAPLDPEWIESPVAAGPRLAAIYDRLLPVIGLGAGNGMSGYTGYNLLMTRQWIMAVPRRQQKFHDVGVNALGFVGTLLVANQTQLEQVRTIGPMTILREVCTKV
ncbi:MAG: ATP adenylyltransferase family protein [Nevskiales bacterium]